MSDSFSVVWAGACQTPLTVGFARQEYWSGLPLPSLGELPNSGIEPTSPALAGEPLTLAPPGKPANVILRFSTAVFLFISILFKTLLFYLNIWTWLV